MADLTTNINYLQPTQFKLVIDRRNYPNLEFFAQSVAHPSVDVQAAELGYKRLTSVAMPGDKLTFGELSAMIILDEDMNSYTEMYNWLERLVETNNTSLANERDTTKIPTYADITLSVLTSHSNGNKEVRYIDCVPTSVGTIDFMATAGDVEYLTFPVSFRFSYFEIK